ncbi:MAG TPA: PDZ domain-containing protein [Pyrinomonadaceae bacterium]
MNRLFLVALAALFSLQTAQAQEEMRLLRYPAIHGDAVVFTYASDLWVADRRGTAARRLTAHTGEERRARISPDGKLIAFVASYDGNADVYVMPLSGGAPRRLTFDPEGEGVVGWTPDGRIAYTSTAGSFTVRQRRLWLIEPDGGLPFETPLLEFSDGSFFPDGKRVAYTRSGSHAQNWRRYRGGNVGRIAIYDFETNNYSELPNKGENAWFPMVAGDAIYYVSDRNQGTVNLYRHDLATKKDTQLTKYTDVDIKWPSMDGKTIVYEHDGYLHAYDISTGKDEKLTFEVKGDELSARPYMLKVGKMISALSLSPKGNRIAAEARGEIFSIAANGEDARNLTATPGTRERRPRWSPDGKTIGYLSDATGDFQIYAQPVTGGEARQLSKHTGATIRGFDWSPDGKQLAYWTVDYRLFVLNVETQATKQVVKAEYDGGLAFDWSPDGRWIAFVVRGKTGFGSLYLYEVATATATRVTDGMYDDDNPTFDLNGKYLYFTSARTFTPTSGRFEASLKVENADRIYLIPLSSQTSNPLFPKTDDESEAEAKPEVKPDAKPETKAEKPGDTLAPVRVDLNGLAERALVLPMPAGAAGSLFSAKNGVYHYSQGKLRKFDLSSKQTVSIYEGPEIQFSFNADQSKLAYFADGTLGVLDVKPGLKHGEGKVDTQAVETWVDPRAEWRQMFWEAWRFEKDNFFREDLWGLDWRAIGKHYEQYLPHVKHRQDLYYVLGLMLGELGTSHAYVYDAPNEPGATERAASASMLGADYERDGQWLRFRRIYPGTLTQDSLRGPLGEPGVNVKAGDYLLEIDGRPVNSKTHPNSFLINKANRVVTLTVNNRPTMEGARRVRVRPVASESQIRYYEWVEGNRRKVEQMSGGRIGYIHYPDTARGGQIEFIRGYYAQTDKDAIILDGRFNSGGSPQPMVLPTLARRWQTVIYARNWQGGSEMQAINGPKAMLINSYAGSGGDLTPWMFRDMGMGALIGTRTLGALVGIAEIRELMDGSQVSAPGYTRFDPKTGEWIAENKGIEPDIEVDARPELIARGRDPQLEAAVQYLLEQLKKNPLKVAPPKLPAVKSAKSN